MTPAQESRAQSIIKSQVEMSGQTLDALRTAGLKDQTTLQLDFFFNAPNEKAAKALVARLEENDCLNLSIERSGTFFRRQFIVKGKTLPTAVTPEILGQWLPWIVVQGIVHDCVFDGWGAEV